MGVQVEERDVPNRWSDWAGDPTPTKVEDRPLRCVKCGASDVLLVGGQRGDQVCALGCAER